MQKDRFQIAAIDLGSNSFHMAIANVEHGEIRVQERLGEKVQLGAGIDDKGRLSKEAIQRGLDCLRMFQQRLRSIEPSNIQVVGTNALRVAKNSQDLIEPAEEVLGVPIEVISGREEARIIYLGVDHTLADDKGSRLVIDIGGGSTEFIVGQRFEPHLLESLHMGCVSYRERFFKQGQMTAQSIDRAVECAERELLPVRMQYKTHGWKQAVGASGSIKAVFQALSADGELKTRITREELDKLYARLVELGDVSRIEELGVKKERCSIFPAGFAILYGAMRSLGIKELDFTQGALREGLLYDLIGRIGHEDVRDRSIAALQKRYSVDTEHADYVKQLTLSIYEQLKNQWGIGQRKWEATLGWASSVFELGLTISHTQYHKHGAYLLKHSDMQGFSKLSQSYVSFIVRTHRRKFPELELLDYRNKDAKALRLVSIVFRIAVLLAADRNHKPIQIKVDASKDTLLLIFDKAWLETHPLTKANLDLERIYLKKIGFELSFC